ncbi:MAG: hypothetical protein JNM19_12425, partial [Chitinophagaceae bacterium]|nr:hypothetical protein [Chitinophagaceae bacterium]
MKKQKKKLILSLFLYLSLPVFSQQKLQHVSSIKNIGNNSTFINAEGLNNNPNAIIIVEYD